MEINKQNVKEYIIDEKNNYFSNYFFVFILFLPVLYIYVKFYIRNRNRGERGNVNKKMRVLLEDSIENDNFYNKILREENNLTISKECNKQENISHITKVIEKKAKIVSFINPISKIIIEYLKKNDLSKFVEKSSKNNTMSIKL